MRHLGGRFRRRLVGVGRGGVVDVVVGTGIAGAVEIGLGDGVARCSWSGRTGASVTPQTFWPVSGSTTVTPVKVTLPVLVTVHWCSSAHRRRSRRPPRRYR